MDQHLKNQTSMNSGSEYPGTPTIVCANRTMVQIKFPEKMEEKTMKKGPEVKEFSCIECNRSFSSGKALGGHLSSAHVQAPKGGLTLRTVKDRLTGGRNFSCRVCDRGFSSKYSLYGHMRSHPKRERREMEAPSWVDSSLPSSEEMEVADAVRTLLSLSNGDSDLKPVNSLDEADIDAIISLLDLKGKKTDFPKKNLTISDGGSPARDIWLGGSNNSFLIHAALGSQRSSHNNFNRNTVDGKPPNPTNKVEVNKSLEGNWMCHSESNNQVLQIFDFTEETGGDSEQAPGCYN